MEVTDKRRANAARILINIGSIIFVALVISNFSGTFELRRLIVGVIWCTVCFGGALWIEK